MKTIENTIRDILEEHHDCRWMDSSDLEDCLLKVVDAQKKDDLEVFCQWLTEFADTIYWEVESPTSHLPMGERFREYIKIRMRIMEE